MRVFLMPLSLVHYLVYLAAPATIRGLIDADVARMNVVSKNGKHGLCHYLVYRNPFRNLFYYRVGKFKTGFRLRRILKLFLPEYPLFTILDSVESIGGGCSVINHPYGTIINAKSIGKNFTICQLTTIGNKNHGDNSLLPVIGDNVSLGANVTIIGGVKVGNNVKIGAGSVVVKDVPDNCIAVGNPAKLINQKSNEQKDRI